MCFLNTSFWANILRHDDGSTDDEGRTARYTFDRPGSYPVRLTVADDEQSTRARATGASLSEAISSYAQPMSRRRFRW